MSPLYCFLFVIGFLCSLQTISADDYDLDDDEVPLGGFYDIEPDSDEVVEAMLAVKPEIALYFVENYIKYASGSIKPPHRAERQDVNVYTRYIVYFNVVPSSPSLNTTVFDALINKQYNFEAKADRHELIGVVRHGDPYPPGY